MEEDKKNRIIDAYKYVKDKNTKSVTMLDDDITILSGYDKLRLQIDLLEQQNNLMKECIINIMQLSCEHKGTPLDYAWNKGYEVVKELFGDEKIKELLSTK